jgi:hypothetical protein
LLDAENSFYLFCLDREIIFFFFISTNLSFLFFFSLVFARLLKIINIKKFIKIETNNEKKKKEVLFFFSFSCNSPKKQKKQQIFLICLFFIHLSFSFFLLHYCETKKNLIININTYNNKNQNKSKNFKLFAFFAV